MIIVGENQNNAGAETNQQMLRKMHLRQIFDLVLANKQVSRAWIAQQLGLSSTAVASLADELIESGMLIEKGLGDLKTAGRKPVIFEINSAGQQIVTVCIDLNKIDFVLYNLDCTEKECIRMKFSGADYVQYIRHILSQSKELDPQKVAALCVTLPAFADPGSHRLLLNILDISDDMAFMEELSGLFPDAVLVVGNDSATFSYAEKEFISAPGVDNLIYINYSYGIGAGIIVGGRMFNGVHGSPGEIGHMSIDVNGPQCECGNKGCLERMTSLAVILRQVKAKIQQGGYSMVSGMLNENQNDITIDMICEAFHQKDFLVTEVIQDNARKLSVGIKNIISIFNPQEIVLGGHAHKFGKQFYDMILEHMSGMDAWRLTHDLKIRYTGIDENGSNLGIAKYYLDHILSFDGRTVEQNIQQNNGGEC